MKIHKKHKHQLSGVFYYGKREDIGVRINVSEFNKGDSFPIDLVHYHKSRTTYFIIITGELVVEVEDNEYILTKNESLEIEPMEKYRTIKVGENGCIFIVVGDHNKQDRVEVK